MSDTPFDPADYDTDDRVRCRQCDNPTDNYKEAHEALLAEAAEEEAEAPLPSEPPRELKAEDNIAELIRAAWARTRIGVSEMEELVRTEAASLRQALAESQSEICEQQVERKELGTRHAALLARAEAAEQERETLRAERDEARANAEWLDVQRFKLTARLTELEAERDILQRDMESQRNTLQHHYSRRVELEARVQELEGALTDALVVTRNYYAQAISRTELESHQQQWRAALASSRPPT